MLGKHMSYLKARYSCSPLVLGFILLFLYRYAWTPNPHASAFILLAGLAALLLFRFPRWTYYVYAFGAMAIIAAYYVFHVANGRDNPNSDRDEAVVIACSALLRGENPWNHLTGLNNPLTTGPSSILIAIPSVALTKHVNVLAFAFWICFFGVLLIGDIVRRNDSFLLLFVLFMFPDTGFGYTMFWANEELYYPLLLFPLSLWMSKRHWFFGCGLLLSIIILGRLSYVFGVAGFMLWFICSTSNPIRPLLRMGLGLLVGMSCILAPFLIIGGQEFIERNFLYNALAIRSTATWSNPVFRVIADVTALAGDKWTSALGSVLALVILSTVTVTMRTTGTRHPFWHVALGGFLAHTIVFAPGTDYLNCYILTIMIPAFLGIAFSESRHGGLLESENGHESCTWSGVGTVEQA
jgi:hypothetical protein